MGLRIAHIDNHADLERMYRFRYRVYVEELGLTDNADHEHRLLSDVYDQCSHSYAIVDGKEILGSLRLILLSEVPDPAPLIHRFRMGPAVDAFGLGAICTTSRFILNPRLQHGTIIYRLMKVAYEAGRARGIRLNYGDCSAHLVPFYEHLGYRLYSSGYNDSDYGYKVPILMLGDRARFKRVRSLLACLVAKEGTDAPVVAWFSETYPNYPDTESAAFLPKGEFLERLKTRWNGDPLDGIYLLHHLTKETATCLLAHATILKYDPGNWIQRKGERDTALYTLLSGTAGPVSRHQGSTPDCHPYLPGDSIGRRAFLSNQAATVTIEAKSPCLVLVVPADSLRQTLSKNAALEAIVKRNLGRRQGVAASTLSA